MDEQVIGVRSPEWARFFSFFSTASRHAVGPTELPTQWTLGAFSPGIKQPRHEDDQSSRRCRVCVEFYIDFSLNFNGAVLQIEHSSITRANDYSASRILFSTLFPLSTSISIRFMDEILTNILRHINDTEFNYIGSYFVNTEVAINRYMHYESRAWSQHRLIGWWWKMNWKWFERRHSWHYQDTIPKIACTDWRKLRKISVRVLVYRLWFEPNTYRIRVYVVPPRPTYPVAILLLLLLLWKGVCLLTKLQWTYLHASH